ncbi:DUF924 family protein [Aquibium microcysteis]|uniref:DUF924 family protein n=1 Tax=Aquibium microcysteis TaxID=675281 RepID=UPI00165CF159|nr:DUF924 family protein [Aquibium microcysteis]
MIDKPATEAILAYWFGELGPSDWFSGRPELDRQIADRFGAVCERALAARPEDFLTDPHRALAGIILLDQFPRQVFRGQPRAFSGDPAALLVTHGALRRGWDTALTADERQFLYMPLMHSEVVSDQELCVKLFRDLGNEEALKFAIEHRDIVARFGRFPHRNAALGRESTPEEREFLGTHGGYGQ